MFTPMGLWRRSEEAQGISRVLPLASRKPAAAGSPFTRTTTSSTASAKVLAMAWKNSIG